MRNAMRIAVTITLTPRVVQALILCASIGLQILMLWALLRITRISEPLVSPRLNRQTAVRVAQPPQLQTKIAEPDIVKYAPPKALAEPEPPQPEPAALPELPEVTVPQASVSDTNRTLLSNAAQIPAQSGSALPSADTIAQAARAARALARAQRRYQRWTKPIDTKADPLDHLPGMKNIKEYIKDRAVHAVYTVEERQKQCAAARLEELQSQHMTLRMYNELRQVFQENPIPFHSRTPINTHCAFRLVFNADGTLASIEMIQSTGVPELDDHLCTIMKKMKKMELPGTQRRGTIWCKTIQAKVTTHAGSGVFQITIAQTKGMYDQ